MRKYSINGLNVFIVNTYWDKEDSKSITIYSERFHQYIKLAFDYSIGDSVEQAIQHLESLGFNIVGMGQHRNNDKYFIMSDTFEPFR
jgi:hypothetical protein